MGFLLVLDEALLAVVVDFGFGAGFTSAGLFSSLTDGTGNGGPTKAAVAAGGVPSVTAGDGFGTSVTLATVAGAVVALGT